MDPLFSLRNKTHSTLTNKNEDLWKRNVNVIMNELARQIQLNALSFVTLEITLFVPSIMHYPLNVCCKFVHI